MFGSILRKQINDIGFAVRYGGDEFILISRQTEVPADAVVAGIVKEIDEIKNFSVNGYQYEPQFSTDTELVFIKN